MRIATHTRPTNFVKYVSIYIPKKTFVSCPVKSASIFLDILDGPFRTHTIRQHLERVETNAYIRETDPDELRETVMLGMDEGHSSFVVCSYHMCAF